MVTPAPNISSEKMNLSGEVESLLFKTDNIPAELKRTEQWVCWRFENVNGRQTKVPYTPDGQRKADTTNPQTWGSFEQACATAQHYQMGVGFVFSDSDPYTGIDLDDKPEKPASPEELAVHQKILQSFNSYTERSPSGRGYHIIIRGTFNGTGRDRGNVGVYTRGRYFTFTGDAINQAPIGEYQQLLDMLLAQMPAPDSGAALVDYSSTQDDADLHHMALYAANGDKYDRLCCGQWQGEYPSQSEADFALLSILAYYSRDNEQVRRLFRMSALGKRAKAVDNDRYINRCLKKIRANEPELIDFGGLQRQQGERVQGSADTLQSGSLRSVDISDVMSAELGPPEFIMDPWIPRRLVTLFGGHGGSGKSYLALVLAAHVAGGVSFAGMAVSQGKVVFVSLEDEASVMRYRLRQVMEQYADKLNPEIVLQNLKLLDGTDGYNALLTASEGWGSKGVVTRTYDEVCNYAQGSDLLIIDNASDAYDANENIRTQVRSFIQHLSHIAKENDAAVMLLAHIDKAAARQGASGNSYSGSTAWHNSCRSRLALLIDKNGRRVEQEKLNGGCPREPLYLDVATGGVPIPKADVSGLVDGPGLSGREALIQCFKEARDRGLDVGTLLTRGNGCALAALRQCPSYLTRWKGKAGDNEALAEIVAMVREELVVREQYMPSNRHPRKRLVLAEHKAAPVSEED